MYNYDLIVVGAGHAGCETAIAGAKLGAKVLLCTLNLDNIALMPCNPAVGGPAKSCLVREIDAIGGIMGIAADATYMQTKILNSSKGPAVRALRMQSDKKEYTAFVRNLIESQDNIKIKQCMVVELLVKDGTVIGVKDEFGLEYYSKAVILTTGTSLEGKIWIGLQSFDAGRMAERKAVGLSQSLINNGIEIKKLRDGVIIDGKKTSKAKVNLKKYDKKTDKSTVELIIHEGRNHQIKKMFESIKHDVIKLKREKYANLDLTNLNAGEYRRLTNKEIAILYSMIKK